MRFAPALRLLRHRLQLGHDALQSRSIHARASVSIVDVLLRALQLLDARLVFDVLVIERAILLRNDGQLLLRFHRLRLPGLQHCLHLCHFILSCTHAVSHLLKRADDAS